MEISYIMNKHFKLEDCHVRLAEEFDRNDLQDIAKSIWDGHDYLPKVLDKWLIEPYFFVCEYQGKVIACIKLSLFPDHVLWFEGLRVKANFQGNGIGGFMNREMFKFAATLKAKDPLLKFEFCTYYKNVESLHLTAKVGFKRVESFYTLDKYGVKAQLAPEIVQNYNMSLFSAYPNYIPLGWQAVHNCEESLTFIQQKAVVFRTPQSTYMLAGLNEKNVVFLSPPVKDIKAELPYFQHFFSPRKKYGIIIPRSYKKHIPRLGAIGFHFWDKEPKIVDNMLILSQ